MANRTANTLWKSRKTYTAAAGRQSSGGIAPGGGQLPPDTVPPVLTNIVASAILDTSATVTWTTNELSTTQVEYDTTTAYGSSTTLANTPAATAGVTSHSASIGGLTAATTYHYRVKSQDKFGNLATSTDNTLTTAAAGALPGMTLGTLVLTPTYQSIGIDQPFTGDTDATGTIPSVFLSTTGALLGATTLPIDALPCDMPSGQRIVFSGGVVATLSSAATLGATSLAVNALSAAIVSGEKTWVTGIQFKRTADSTWRFGLPAVRTDIGGTDDGTKRNFFAKLMMLDPATSYNVRLSVQRASSQQIVTGSVTTLTDSISSHATLVATATHFVATTGDDTTGDGSSGTPWATIDKALQTAPANAVIRVAPGWYLKTTFIRTTAFTMVSQFPVITNDTTRALETDVAKQTVIYSGIQAAPTGTTPATGYTVAPWTLYTTTANSRNVWKWTGAGVGIRALGFHTTRADLSNRSVGWRNDTPAYRTNIDTWISLLDTNRSVNTGWTRVTGSADIYMVMDGTEGTTDPNTLWWTAGASAAEGATTWLLAMNAPSSRLCGLRFEAGDRGLVVGGTGGSNATDNIIDHCAFSGCKENFRVEGSAALAGFTKRTTVQYNRFYDHGLWNSNDPGGKLWLWIKQSTVQSDGTNYPTIKLGTLNETGAGSARQGFRQMVYRYNTVDGTFNGFFLGPQNGISSTAPDTKYEGADSDCHNNVFIRVPDDPFEPENPIVCMGTWDNDLTDTFTIHSAGPNYLGPVIQFRNKSYRWAQVAWKYSGSGTVVAAPQHAYFCTYWTNNAAGSARGSGQFAGGGTNTPVWYFYNNILRSQARVHDLVNASRLHEDYNFYGTPDTTANDGGFIFGGIKYVTIAAYRTATGQGPHTNKIGSTDYDFSVSAATLIDGELNNPTSGDLTLKVASVLKGIGIPVPNLADRATNATNWVGNQPSLGYTGVGI